MSARRNWKLKKSVEDLEASIGKLHLNPRQDVERAESQDELKKSVEDLESEVARWNNLKDVERSFAEWERGFDAAVVPYCSEPAVWELIERLKREHRKARLKEAKEARCNTVMS